MPMSLEQLSDIICRTVGKTDSASVALCKDFARARYQMIFNSSNWRESELTLSISVAAGQSEAIIPHEMERVKAARWSDDTTLWPVEMSNLMESDPGVFDRTGTPNRFAELGTVGVATAPGGSVITVVSSSAADTGLTVSIRGEVGATEYQETLTLNGTTTVTGTIAWDRIFVIGKPETAGTITVRNSASTVLVALWPFERARQHCRLYLQEKPLEADTLFVVGKRRARELWLDSDVPILRNIDQALMAYTMSDMLIYARQYTKADSKLQDGHAQLAIMRNLDSEQGARMFQIVPAGSGEYNRYDFRSSNWLRD